MIFFSVYFTSLLGERKHTPNCKHLRVLDLMREVFALILLFKYYSLYHYYRSNWNNTITVKPLIKPAGEMSSHLITMFPDTQSSHQPASAHLKAGSRTAP